MFLQTLSITPTSTASEIVKKDYRAAEVFHRYGVDYCCNARWPLEAFCNTNGINFEDLRKDLAKVTRDVKPLADLPFETWDLDFLIDYIINIHHHYLHRVVPGLKEMLGNFTKEHGRKKEQFQQVMDCLVEFEREIFPHIHFEEETIFPYLKQLSHAYNGKDSFARLFVKTMRKPVNRMMEQEENILINSFLRIRELTGNYQVPDNACTSQQVILLRLKDLDNETVQHIYLENEIFVSQGH